MSNQRREGVAYPSLPNKTNRPASLRPSIIEVRGRPKFSATCRCTHPTKNHRSPHALLVLCRTLSRRFVAAIEKQLSRPDV
jgi:hypothetical protein